MSSIAEKEFQNQFTRHFEGDDSGDRTPRQTPGKLYSTATPTPVAAPKLLAWSKNLAEELGIADPFPEDVQILAGNKVTASMKPYAACYAGHQFGNWAGQLGDGRAITLGEWGAKNGIFELQLKGAGPTAYSRHADGRAVLRSSVREYLMSEAMHHLGIPTTRALALVETGDKVLRDMFYNGNPEYEPGAIVTRVAPSFLRFGNYELLAAQGENDKLKRLIDWTIDRYFPHLTEEDRILAWFGEVVDKTAFLMTEWQRVGFVHGVINTDNMSILGLTIDYGPFSFLDHYDHNFTPNTTDLPGRRYAFGNQPSIGYWNLGRLANALSVLFDDTEGLENALDSYEQIFWNYYYDMMGKKLGFTNPGKDERKIIARFEAVLSAIQPDMTIFYRLLAEMPLKADAEQIMKHFQPSFYNELQPKDQEEFVGLLTEYQKLRKNAGLSEMDRKKLMNEANPRIILRNYLLHQAIEELEQGESKLFLRLQEAMKQPYATEGFDELVKKRPEWAETKAGCSMLSCSS
ncbi:YdiU family protein [Salinimicrobium tongyeongense]|uniref:Protein nucleotidyltransferase YdiU n=1 Tax=Salinimicrobium tongyeongense TaxID=2809707 RepID=A0ABY6NSQ3_9FLAO|nr:YdiU family protein [Salinimicrobium tongyeongense]UZH55934.1 YdiU family protein [Salinimicrobium tongyeongense]